MLLLRIDTCSITLEMKEVFVNCTAGASHPSPLPGENRNAHYLIIGEHTSPLETWLMKPFRKQDLTEEERIFNYRLSRDRRIVEKAFRILANCWQCILVTMRPVSETVNKIVVKCCFLHNLMRMR